MKGGCVIEKFLFPIGVIVVSILLGRALRELSDRGLISDSVPLDDSLKKVIRFVLLGINPIIILGSFWFVKLDSSKLIWLPLLGIFSLVLGGGLALGASRLQKLDRAKTGAMIVSGSFTNMGSFGTLFCFVFIGPESLPYIAMFRLLEEFIYYSVGFPVAKMFGTYENQGEKKLISLITDPFIMISFLSILAGCLLNVSPWERPSFFGDFISFAVPFSTFLLVVPIGFNMRLKAVREYLRECCSISLVKFLMVPLIVTSLGYVLGIGLLEDQMVLKVILILTAMPPAFTSLVPPQLYKLDSDLANSSWIFNSALLLLIAPMLYYVVQSL